MFPPSLEICHIDVLTAFLCVTLFEDSWDIYPSDLQEQSKGECGAGLYVTTDLRRCLRKEAESKTILVVEFGTVSRGDSDIHLKDILLADAGDYNRDQWREKGYGGVQFGHSDFCVSVDMIRCVYRRSWPKEFDPTATDWNALSNLMSYMNQPPFLISSARSADTWIGALDALRLHADREAERTSELCEQQWNKKILLIGETMPCGIQ